jgi:predicted kinase
MAHVHLVVGPVGAGKSTYALRLARDHRAVRMNLDEWMAELFRPDRPSSDITEWYIERARRCVDQIWREATRCLEVGTSVVLEVGLIRRADRQRFCARVDTSRHGLTIHVLDVPREVRRERVERRNRERGETFSVEVPSAFFELASDTWEPLDDEERAGRDVRILPWPLPGDSSASEA